MSTLTEKGKLFSFFLLCLEKNPLCIYSKSKQNPSNPAPPPDIPTAPKPLTSFYLILLSNLFTLPLRPV